MSYPQRSFSTFSATKLKLCKTMNDKTESEELTFSNMNKNIELKKNFMTYRHLYALGGSAAFLVLCGMDSRKVALSVLANRWLSLFYIWIRLSWPEFLPHSPYQTRPARFRINSDSLIPDFCRPRLLLIPRLTR